MRNTDFFRGIAHEKVLWRDGQLSVPVFYYDMMYMMVMLLTPVRNVKNLLPSARMNPYRMTPWHGIVAISAYEYRDSDIGPYCEVSISVPFVMDRVSSPFAGIVRKTTEVPMMYVWHLPVTTEIARSSGVELAGFPKFLADISFEKKNEWTSCRACSAGKHILTLTGRELKLIPFPRQRICPITLQHDYLLRLEMILSECKAGISQAQSDIQLELGDHQIANELREIGMGRVIMYQYCPQRQAILTPVCESYHSKSFSS